MTRAVIIAIVLWFSFAVLFPRSINAQSEQNPIEKNESTKIETSPERGMTLSSEPEIPGPEFIEELGLHRRIVRIGENFHLRGSETVGSIILVGGNAKIQGQVIGDILVLKGNLKIGEGAHVLGRVTVVLGALEGREFLGVDAANKANLYKEINGLRLVPVLAKLMMHPQRAWGMKKEAGFSWSVLTFIMLTLVHTALVMMFSQKMKNMADIISRRPLGSTLIGLIVLIIVPYLATVLVVSIVGIPLMLVFLSTLLPMAIYGKTAIFLSMGNTIFPQQSNVVAVVVGYCIYRMPASIPHIDWLTFVVASTIGIGLTARTLFGQKSSRTPRPLHHRRYPPPRQSR